MMQTLTLQPPHSNYFKISADEKQNATSTLLPLSCFISKIGFQTLDEFATALVSIDREDPGSLLNLIEALINPKRIPSGEVDAAAKENLFIGQPPYNITIANFVEYIVNTPGIQEKLLQLATTHQYEVFAQACLKLVDPTTRVQALQELQTAHNNSPAITLSRLSQRGDGTCGPNTLACKIVLAMTQDKLNLSESQFNSLWEAIVATFPIIKNRNQDYLQDPFIQAIEPLIQGKQKPTFEQFKAFIQEKCLSREGLWGATLFLAPALRYLGGRKKLEELYADLDTENPLISREQKLATINHTISNAMDGISISPSELEPIANFLGIHLVTLLSDSDTGLEKPNSDNGDFVPPNAVTTYAVTAGGHWDLLLTKEDLSFVAPILANTQPIKLTKPFVPPKSFLEESIVEKKAFIKTIPDYVKSLLQGLASEEQIREQIDKIQQEARSNLDRTTRQSTAHQSFLATAKRIFFTAKKMPTGEEVEMQDVKQTLKEISKTPATSSVKLGTDDWKIISDFANAPDRSDKVVHNKDSVDVSFQITMPVEEYRQYINTVENRAGISNVQQTSTHVTFSKTLRMSPESYNRYCEDRDIAEKTQLEEIAKVFPALTP